ncbi:MAG TPA: hypothetical protein PKD64_14365 [Pirellulaceae bacterium]|nr:hypothetical protein [Pirellulaceae bacterium]HMO93371.1 hypothetical protein [Pirellulaceae bacterium]HMP70430.1 hypothetical protein [Pirellulaceae bacterium]
MQLVNVERDIARPVWLGIKADRNHDHLDPHTFYQLNARIGKVLMTEPSSILEVNT